MTFLPIVERELRVAARKRSTFWVRTSAAIAGLVLGVMFLILFELAGPMGSTMGGALFGVLTVLAFAAALLAGVFFTADCLSEEKREGTLGFLFLTDLRGYDVVAGKLLATSLRAAFALLAILPILALTLLMGAVTGTEFWKTSLALLNTLLCSLAAGLCISAISRDPQRALAGTVGLLIALCAVGPLADALIGSVAKGRPPVLFSLTSPLFLFIKARAWGRNPFWLGLGINLLAAWALFALACLAAPRAWQDKRRHSTLSPRVYRWTYGGARRRLNIRRRLLERNAVLWLASRERWQALGGWALAVLFAAVIIGLLAGKAPPAAWMAMSWAGSLFVFFLYLWTASQASRFFVEGRRNGLFELLLVTPLRVEEIVRGHWRALARLFALPTAIVLLAQVAAGSLTYIFMTRTVAAAGPVTLPSIRVSWSILSALAGATTTLVSLVAVVWFGMWMGLKFKGTGLATLMTLLFAKIIPMMVVQFVAGILSLVIILPFLMSSVTSATTTVTTNISTAGMTVVTNWSPGGSGVTAPKGAFVVTAPASGTNAAGTFTATATTVVMPPMLPFFVLAWVAAALNIVVELVLIGVARKKLHRTFRDEVARGFTPAGHLAPRPAPPAPAPAATPAQPNG